MPPLPLLSMPAKPPPVTHGTVDVLEGCDKKIEVTVGDKSVAGDKVPRVPDGESTRVAGEKNEANVSARRESPLPKPVQSELDTNPPAGAVTGNDAPASPPTPIKHVLRPSNGADVGAKSVAVLSPHADGSTNVIGDLAADSSRVDLAQADDNRLKVDVAVVERVSRSGGVERVDGRLGHTG